jgi:lipopolysaccharide export system protein LptC
MARADRHTRLVAWLKVALPLTALSLLATLFLLAERIDPSNAIPYAQVDVEDLARDPRMTAPAYAGTTADGSAITVTARAARPAAEGRQAAALDVRAVLDLPDGTRTEASAGLAEVDADAGLLTLSEGVLMVASSGWSLDLPAVTLRLDRTGAESDGPVSARGPAGSVSSGGFQLSLSGPSDTPTSVLVFTDRVKLVYRPAEQ